MSVVAVPMNPSWKRKNAVRNALSLPEEEEDVLSSAPASAPNINANPNSQKSDDAMRKLVKFGSWLIEFFDRPGRFPVP